MPPLDYFTAGESHGPAGLVTVLNMPAGVRVDVEMINAELARRQGGYGRGGRQRIETDRIEILSGVRLGKTIGSPVTLLVPNKDSRLDDLERTPPLHRPRPGHADLPGSLKWLTTDCRETLERASARETAARVAGGALARCYLRELGIETFGLVRQIGTAASDVEVTRANVEEVRALRDKSQTYCPDAEITEAQCAIIRKAKVDKDTAGGIVEAHVFGCPPGFGSCMQWTDRLDARIAYAVMGIQAFKAVEIGLGRECANRPGSQVHDPIGFDESQREESTLGFTRPTNNAGGLEGGMTNGQPVVVRGTMKPISTLLRGLPSINLNTRKPEDSQYERSDVCAVSAASVVMEHAIAFEVARAVSSKLGGDSMRECKSNLKRYMQAARELPTDS